jgi:MFS family permease
MSRGFLLVLAFLPFLLENHALVWAAIALSVIRDALANLSFPSWISLTGDIVPFEGRGRYFASRSFVMSLAGMTITFVAGWLITRSSLPGAYQAALVCAALLGMSATFSFSRIRDPNPEQAQQASPGFHLGPILKGLAAHPTFLGLCLTTALWNLSLNIAGPFLTVYLVQDLNASPTVVGLNAALTSLSAILVQRKMGELADKWGPRRLQQVSGFLIPILPMMWLFVTQAWHVLPLNFVGGALWAAYNLAAFSFLLSVTPDEQRARYSAIYQVVVMLSLSAGAALGGQIIEIWGYPAIFILSSLGRVAGAILFARYVLPARAAKNAAAFR